MNSKSKPSTINIGLDHISVYPFLLKTDFTTAHSKSTLRMNALFSVYSDSIPQKPESSTSFIGYGESGLPPKKPKCYLADYSDCVEFLKYFSLNAGSASCEIEVKSLSSIQNTSTTTTDDLFGQNKYFEAQLDFFPNFRKLLQLQPPSNFLAAKAGLEASYLNLISCSQNIPIFKILNLDDPTKNSHCHIFFTVGICPLKNLKMEINKAISTFSPHIKFKMGVPDSLDYFHQFLSILKSELPPHSYWCVDANASWSPELSLKFLSFLKKFPNLLSTCYMIEQPFPLDILSMDHKNRDIQSAWTKVKQEYVCGENIEIFVDESFSSFSHLSDAQIKLITKISSGINIKVEKSGGLVEAIRCAKISQDLSLSIWFGCMVSSEISTMTVAHLLSMSSFGCDLDGHLLVEISKENVKNPQWKPMFSISKNGTLVRV